MGRMGKKIFGSGFQNFTWIGFRVEKNHVLEERPTRTLLQVKRPISVNRGLVDLKNKFLISKIDLIYIGVRSLVYIGVRTECQSRFSYQPKIRFS